MKRVIPFVAGLVALLAVSTPAFAQQHNKPAVVVMSSGLGVLLPASDQVAIRPEFTFNKASTENTGTVSTTKFDSWQVGGAVSALFYMGKPDTFRTYWAPRIAMTHQNSNSTGSNSYVASGAFGAQYGLGDRFKAFGELGVSYGWQNAESKTTTSLGATLTSTTKNRSFGTRSIVGVAFNF